MTVSSSVTSNLAARTRGWIARHPALFEIGILLLTYGIYFVVRISAQGDLDEARGVADAIVRIEKIFLLDVEQSWNAFVVDIGWLRVLSAYWYFSLHYVVTISILLTAYFRFPRHYRPLRRALLASTFVALALYILMPTAPPRHMPSGYTDVVAMTMGWNDGQPTQDVENLSEFTNEFAAFPSMHAGWALWAMLAIFALTRSPIWRGVGVAYASLTAVDVVVTANHWVIDIFAGWAIIYVGYLVFRRGLPEPGEFKREFRRSRSSEPQSSVPAAR